MPIRVTPVIHDGICIGNRWHIDDYGSLVTMIARVAMGSYLHVERVIHNLATNPPPFLDSAAEQAQKRLAPPDGDPQRYHRDGWVFQIISWIAAQVGEPGQFLTAAPHCRMADKGFDCVLIPAVELESRLESIILCEDKATENPRNTITSKVWPEILTLEKGARDAELVSEVTTLLRGRVSDERVEQIIQGIYWKESRHYRVGITLPDSCSNDVVRRAVFADFEAKAPGDITRRRAESLELPDLRSWMDQVCADCIRQIDALDS